MTFNLNNQVAVITGASGNLGQATARAFRASGAKLALIARIAIRLQSLYPELSTAPNVFFAAPYYLEDPTSTSLAIQKIIEKYGRIDILVNTVGGYLAGKPVHETDLDAFDHIVELEYAYSRRDLTSRHSYYDRAKNGQNCSCVWPGRSRGQS